MELEDLDKAQESYEAMLLEAIRMFPDLLDKLTVEERLAGIDHEALLAELDPRERVAGLGPDELLNALSPEMRAELARRLAH